MPGCSEVTANKCLSVGLEDRVDPTSELSIMEGDEEELGTLPGDDWRDREREREREG